MHFCKKSSTVLCVLLLILSIFAILKPVFAQDETSNEKVIERYKLMLSRKPKEGSTFDRLYQFYLEGDGLAAMVADYESEAEAKPKDANIQLILGHINKRLGNDTVALTTYQRAVELAPNDYYAYFAIGQMYVTLRKHVDAIRELNKAATLSDQTKSVSPEELTAIYKALGSAYFSRDMLDEAIQSWEKISELDPENVFARIELADLFREKELFEQAIAQHKAIIDIKSDEPYRMCLSLREIGKIHEEMGAFDKARNSYDKALELTTRGNWLRRDIQQRIIAIYSADANWKDLIAYYQGKLDSDANDTEILGLLAAAYIENEQLDEGIQKYRKGLELAPTDTSLRLKLIAALRNAEKFEDAALEYETISEQQPDNFGIYRELGKIYLEFEDEAKARTVYQRMIDRDPSNASTFLTLAEIYTGHDWLEDAATAYQKAISLAPEILDFVEYYGEFYFRQGDGKKAIETWNIMVEEDKNTAENYDRLARLLESKKFTDKAIEASQKAVELMPDTYRFREALAKRLMDNAKFDEALIEYTHALKLAPNDFFAEQMDDQRIELYRRNGTIVEKIEHVETELTNEDITPEEKFAHFKRLAKMYIKISNSTYALEILLQAKELLPDDVNINRWTADVFVKQGRRDDAIAIYQHLTVIDSKNSREYYANIANAYLKGLDFEESTEAAKKVVAHSPRNPEGHQLLAQIAKQSANYEQAIQSYKQAIRLQPEKIENRIELAVIYKLSGKHRESIAQYWRCWELSDSISEKIGFIKPLTDAYYDLGRHEELGEMLKLMAKTDASDISPVLALADIYRKEGDLLSARFQIARALDRQSENTHLLTQLVDISIDLGDIQEALNYQERLVKVQPDPIHRQKLGELLYDLGREQEAIQTWSKVLHSKNQTLEAEIKLAKLLIQHGLLEEALSALDNAAEKITGKDAHLALYQIGSTLVSMNEDDRAIPHFQRVLDMSKPISKSSPNVVSKNVTTNVPQHYGPPGINLRRLGLASSLQHRIVRQPYGYSSGQVWSPSSFEEAQSAALVQLRVIMEGEGRFDELIQQFEKKTEQNPKDIQTLELLTQLYGLMGDQEKSDQIIEKLIAASPNNLLYQSMQIQRDVFQGEFDYQKIMKKLDNLTGLTEEARQWYMIVFLRRLYSQGQKEDANQLLDDLEKMEVTDPTIIPMLVQAYALMERTDATKKIISDYAATASPQLLQQISQSYQTLASVYLRNDKVEEAATFYWKYFEQTKPKSTNARRTLPLGTSNVSYGGYTPIQSNFPSPTIYYNQNRMRSLQRIFNQFWINDQQEVFYTVLQTEMGNAEDRERIYPALALCYCYWWDNKRDDALQILASLQEAFSDDITLKLNTALVSIQTGNHKEALKLLEDLVKADPRNRRQYFDLTLQIAVHIGDTLTVRELMTKFLNSPSSVRELYQFSQKLQQAGLTQYAIAVAKKTMTLALSERDPNFLVELSQHLNRLGRGQDAARIAARALQFSNQTDRFGRVMYAWNLQKASRLAGPSMNTGNRATKLIEAVEKNPNSFPAQLRLASYYASRNQVLQASNAFEAALKLRPNDYGTRQRFVQFLEQNRQFKNAVEQYSIMLKDKSTQQFVYSNYYQAVRTFTEAGESAKLVEIAKDIIDIEDQYQRGSEFARRIAEEMTRNKKPKLTVEIYEKMMESSNYQVYNELTDAYVAAGKREKAIQLLREKLQSEETLSKVGIIIQLAKLTETENELKELSTKHDELIAGDKVEPSLLYFAAVTKIVTKDLEASDEIVNRLLENIPSRYRIQWLSTLADTYRNQLDVDREIQVLQAAIKKVDPQTYYQLSNIYNQLGTAYAKNGDKGKALEYIRKMGAIRLMRQVTPQYYEKESIARIYIQHELWDEAEILLTEVINDLSAQQYYKERAQEQLIAIRQKRDGVTGTQELDSGNQSFNISVQRSMARKHMNRNRIPEAIKLYEQIAKVMPQDLDSRSQLATLYSRQVQHDKSIETWKALLETDPENTKFKDGIINAYRSAGKVGEAIVLAKKYIEEDAEAGTNYTRLARLYAFRNQTEEAITTYTKAIELSPGDGPVHQELGSLYMQDNKLDEAEKSYNEAKKYVQQAHQLQAIEQQMMEIYRRRGKIDEFLKEAEKKGTLSFNMQKSLARSYQDSGKFDEAIKSYQKAIQMTTDDWQQRDVERQLLLLLRQHGKLEQHLKEAEKNGTLTFGMQVELARHYKAKGESDNAIKAYKDALEMSARSYDFDNVYRDLIQEYVRLGKDDLAIELYDTMEQSESSGTSITHNQNGFIVRFGDDKARETIINAYKSAGKLEELKKLFDVRLAKTPNDPVSLEVVAELYRNAKNNQKAAEAYQALIKTSPNNIHAYFYAAAAYNKNGKSELANELLNQGDTALSSSNEAQNLWFVCSIGSICFEGNLYSAAIKHLKQALVVKNSRNISSGNRWEEEVIYDLIAKSALALKQYDEAVEAFTQLKSITRDSRKKAQAEKAIKQAYKDGNLFEKQLPEHIKKVEDNPKDINARLQLAQIYEQNEMPNEALTHYKKLSEIQPDKAQWHKKLGDLYVSASQTNREENLKKAANAFEKALSLETKSYDLYSLLANIYNRQGNRTKVENVYRQALQAPLKSADHDSAIKAILELYPGVENAEKRVSILKEFSKKPSNSPLLHKMLGDTYVESGDTDNATTEYKKWLELTKDESRPPKRAREYHHLADKLIAKNTMPEIVLALLEQTTINLKNPLTMSSLGTAYLMNGQFDKALDHYLIGLRLQDHSHRISTNNIKVVLDRISQARKNVKDKDKDKYTDMISKLIDSLPTEFGSQLDPNLLMAEFSRDLGMNEKAKTYVLKTGFFPETAWLNLGPFDNSDGVGYNTTFIAEEVTQIDVNAKYDGYSGQVMWQQGSDKIYDGFYSFGDDEKWLTAYAWISFTSPDDRKAQIRFDSDDQGKVWLNGKKVYAHRRTRGAQIDRRTIPVTITAGKNTILVKVSNESLPWGFYLRITDTNGIPFNDLTINRPQ